jgi:hypothetical protein
VLGALDTVAAPTVPLRLRQTPRHLHIPEVLRCGDVVELVELATTSVSRR